MKTILYVVTLVGIWSCNDNIHVYSPDRSQCFTIIHYPEFRYIVAGDIESLPDTNYVKLDIRNVIPNEEELAGCWKNSDYDWSITIDGAKIIENKLDPAKFRFSNKLPLDSLNLPSLKSYSKGKDCYHFGFEMFSVVPNGNAIVEQ